MVPQALVCRTSLYVISVVFTRDIARCPLLAAGQSQHLGFSGKRRAISVSVCSPDIPLTKLSAILHCDLGHAPIWGVITGGPTSDSNCLDIPRPLPRPVGRLKEQGIAGQRRAVGCHARPGSSTACDNCETALKRVGEFLGVGGGNELSAAIDGSVKQIV